MAFWTTTRREISAVLNVACHRIAQKSSVVRLRSTKSARRFRGDLCYLCGIRTALHSDRNSFYASIEYLYHPEVEDKLILVAGNVEVRTELLLNNQFAKSRLRRCWCRLFIFQLCNNISLYYFVGTIKISF